jgi:Flp pilus assembly secretin CpaC
MARCNPANHWQLPGRCVVGMAAATALFAGACGASHEAGQGRPRPTMQREARDAILYDKEFWAETPSPVQANGSRSAAPAAPVQGDDRASAAVPAPASHRGMIDASPQMLTADEALAAAERGGTAGRGEVARLAALNEADIETETEDADESFAEVGEGDASGQYAHADTEAGGASVVQVRPPSQMDRLAAERGNGPGEASLITNFKGALQVPAGRSALVRLSKPAERVAIANPEVAEVVVVSPYEILINGKGERVKLNNGDVALREAQTSLIVWDRDGRSDMRTLYINRSRTEQVLLEVTVAEVNRTVLERYGIDWNFFQGGNLVFAKPANLHSPGNTINDVIPGSQAFAGEIPISSDRLTFLWKNFNEDFTIFLELLQQEALAKILAKPLILARSGEEAHLRVGGEVPIVYATANVATIEFKEFGTLLSFTPEFTDDGMIDLRVEMEVSEPTAAFGTAFAGFEVPSFVGRTAQTRVLLARGQSLLIGGLYREQTQESEDKVPYLGDIPFIGSAFKKTVYSTQKTELVMAVKPRVASPNADSLAVRRLPTDRPPLSRKEVRTQPNPYGVTRPRIFRKPTQPKAPGPQSADIYLEEGKATKDSE